MFNETPAFSGFSVNDIDAARKFYGETLGVKVKDGEMGMLRLELFGDGGEVMIYPKEDHQPATYTMLNFVVKDLDKTVDELVAKGVKFEHYGSDMMKQDERGIAHGKAVHMGPDIAWMKDPAGNVIAVMEV
jgi:predicted enzyme related to lactoylglutathione lyase